MVSLTRRNENAIKVKTCKGMVDTLDRELLRDIENNSEVMQKLKLSGFSCRFLTLEEAEAIKELRGGLKVY